MMRSGVPLDYIKVLVDDRHGNFTDQQKEMFLVRVEDAWSVYDLFENGGDEKKVVIAASSSASAEIEPSPMMSMFHW